MRTDQDLETYKLRMRAAQGDPEARAEVERQNAELVMRVEAVREAWGFGPARLPPAARRDNVLPFRKREERSDATGTDLPTAS